MTIKKIKTGDYPSFFAVIDKDRLRRFLKVIGEDSEAFMNREQATVPPGFLFHIALENRFDIRCHIDTRRTVAIRHVQSFYRPIPLDATLNVHPAITSVKERSGWTEVEVVVRYYLGPGDLACEQTTVFWERKVEE